MKQKHYHFYLTIILFILLSSVSSRSNGQELVEKKNGEQKQSDYVFASAGASIPIGYINESIATSISAHAGPVLTMGYHHYFNKRWGMGLVASGSIYKSKPVTRGEYFNEFYFNSYPTGYFSKAQIYISGSYTLFLRRRWSLDIVQGFGLLYMKQPGYEYSYNYSNGQADYHSVRAESGLNTAYDIGIKTKILWKENISLLASVNYFNASGIREYVYQGFNSVDLELGLVWNLNTVQAKNK